MTGSNRDTTRTRLWRVVLLMTGSSATWFAISLLFLPFLTRAYSTVEFGIYGTIYAVAACATPIATLGLQFAIPLARNDQSAAAIIRLSAIASVAVAVVSGFGLSATRPYWLPTHALFPALELAAAVAILANSTLQVQTYLAIRLQDYRSLSRERIVQSVAVGFSQLVASLLSPTALGLVAGQAFGIILAMSTLVRRANIAIIRLRVDSRSLATTLKANRAFALLQGPAQSLSQLGWLAQVPLITAIHGAEPAGAYFVALRLLTALLLLASIAFGQIFYAEWARQSREGGLIVSKHASILALMLGMAGGLLFVSIIIVGRSPVEQVLGEAWGRVHDFVLVLSAGFFIVLPVHALCSFALLGRPGMQLAIEATRFVFMIAAFVIAKAVGLSLSGTAIVVSASLTASYVIHGIVWLKIARRRIAPDGRLTDTPVLGDG